MNGHKVTNVPRERSRSANARGGTYERQGLYVNTIYTLFKINIYRFKKIVSEILVFVSLSSFLTKKLLSRTTKKRFQKVSTRIFHSRFSFI